MTTTLSSPLSVAAGFSRRYSPRCFTSRGTISGAATRKPVHERASDTVMEDTSSRIIEDPRRKTRVMWGNIAWWIVVSYSVPFAFYTLPFIYGDLEIYKHFTVTAHEGKHDLAGLHIAAHLRTWQVHSAAALLFITIGPFQFNTSFRNRHRVTHKRLGYVFALCTVATAVTGGTTMSRASELGPVAMGMSPFLGAGTLVALAVSIGAARRKDFQTHRRWMLRSAAIGYSVMYTRMLPVFIQLLFCGLSNREALDYSFPLSLALNAGLAEIYIQLYLSQPDKNRTGTNKKVS